MIEVTELKTEKEKDAVISLYNVYSCLAGLTEEERKRVYARWQHMKLIKCGNEIFWEREFKRVTAER